MLLSPLSKAREICNILGYSSGLTYFPIYHVGIDIINVIFVFEF